MKYKAYGLFACVLTGADLIQLLAEDELSLWLRLAFFLAGVCWFGIARQVYYNPEKSS